MSITATAVVNLIVILVIGIIIGIGFHRYSRTWLSSQTARLTGTSDVTFALVCVAGSFIGGHLLVLLGFLPTPIMLFIGAAVGTIVTVWLWRGR